MDDALKMRHAAALARAERDIIRASKKAFGNYLPKVTAAVTLGGLAAFADEDESWAAEVEALLAALLLIFRPRYGDGGGRQALLEAEFAKYADEIRPYLISAKDQVYEAFRDNKTFNHQVASKRLGQTQALSAYNAGAWYGVSQYARLTGLNLSKRWLSVRDGDVRLTHAPITGADGQIVPIGGMFTVGGFAARYPGAPELPAHEAVNCRCVMIIETRQLPVVATGGPVEPEEVAELAQAFEREEPDQYGSNHGILDELPDGWRGPIALLDRPTGDQRMLLTPPNGLRTRQYPMSVTREHVGPGKDIFIGTIDRSWIHPEMPHVLMGEGRWDLGGRDGREAARLCGSKMLQTMSIQPDETTIEQGFMDPEGKLVGFEEATVKVKTPEGAEYHDLKEGYKVFDLISDWRLASVAMVSIPAFDEARIEPVFGYVWAQKLAEDELAEETFEELLEQVEDSELRGKLLRAAEDSFAADNSHGELVAAVIGNTGYPVYPERKHKWDGHQARQRVAKWASSDGSGDLDKINWSKFGRAFLYRGKPKTGNSAELDAFHAELRGFAEEDAPKTGYRVEDFKLGFVDIIDGKPYIVANGLIGIAGGHGVTATKGIPEAEVKAIKRKLCTLYSKARNVFSDFPECPFSPSSGKPSQASLEPELIAAAGQVFNRESFQDPKFTGPTPLTVKDGRVFGHVALFDACYMAPGGNRACLTPPRNASYDRFHVHGARLDDGSILPVGMITFGEGHRAHGGLKAAQAAYANIATGAAKVRVGEDEFGVWCAGEVLDQFADRADDLLLSPLSGHWEPDLDQGGALTLIAAHVVVSPGFHVPRLVASYDAEGELEAVQFTTTFLEKSAELFDEALESGEIVPVGEREDGVVLYDEAAALETRQAAKSRLNKFVAMDALKRIGVSN